MLRLLTAARPLAAHSQVCVRTVGARALGTTSTTRDSYFHVHLQSAADYLQKRAPYRAPHLERAEKLRRDGQFLAGGPSDGGRRADLFFHVPSVEAAARMVEEDPYWRGQVWEAYTIRRFEFFVPPSAPETVPLCLDGSRVSTLIEGPAPLAAASLQSLAQAQRLILGGLLADEPHRLSSPAPPAEATPTSRWVTVLPTAVPAEAFRWLSAALGTDAAQQKQPQEQLHSLAQTRSWIYVL